jgi:hypothetical protein
MQRDARHVGLDLGDFDTMIGLAGALREAGHIGAAALAAALRQYGHYGDGVDGAPSGIDVP